ncbi:MAG TPA: 50S ribosomal protein L17 [Planctomycetaceae bacterium]|jgi:large subunit ribosomal protein L17
MRHKVKGRTLGRNAQHRKAMFRNMAASFIRTLHAGDDDPNKPKTLGRIITTVEKAKELRPYIEKLVTIARKSLVHEHKAQSFSTTAQRNSAEWKSWRESDNYAKWAQAIAPAVTYRRKAFALLRDKLAVQILFGELAKRFETRDGGYTRIVRIATRRLGDAGHQALIEFVGVHDRVKQRRARPAPAPVVESAPAPAAEKPAS